MILELTASRVLAPHIGTSTFVWTSIIGIIMASLSIGYYFGGKLADKNKNPRTLSFLILGASLLVGLTALIKDPVIVSFGFIEDVRITGIIGTILLFAPASILLGTIAPYSIRLSLEKIATSGSVVGRLGALSTIGSIVGTFLTGFFLLSYFGNTKILVMLSVLLALTSLLPLLAIKSPKIKTAAIIIALTTLVGHSLMPPTINALTLDTSYSDVMIYDTTQRNTERPIRILQMSATTHSAMFLDDPDELVFPYSKFYHLDKYYVPEPKKALILGGGAYSYPKEFLKRFPAATIDVVEIDPKLTELAREHFDLQDDPRMNIYHQDARVFLNRNQEKYDIIYLDAFNSTYSIPYQLTTIEVAKMLEESLTDDGVILMNIISSLEGDKSKLFRSEYHTYEPVFPSIEVFPVFSSTDSDMVQNIILAIRKTTTTPPENPLEYDTQLNNLWTKSIPNDLPILTDEFAPVDQYVMEVLKK